MARSLQAYGVNGIASTGFPHQTIGETGRNVFFRALVDLGTGGVAGIETARGRTPRVDAVAGLHDDATARGVSPILDALGAWGQEVREPAAYMVRGGLATHPGKVGQVLGVDATRVILMFDVTDLLVDPAKALRLLLDGKRAGLRILLDNFDMEDPPARFMELLPADILRVTPGRMPWHWEESRRQEAMESLLGFAGNLLMDVAVEGVDSGGQRRVLRRLGVRYALGGWRRDTLGLVPDPVRV
jgi:hypothetical protein